MTTNEPGIVGAVERSLEVIEALDELGSARVNEVSEHLGYATSSVHNHLATLHKHGYVHKQGDMYANSLKHLYISEGVRKRYNVDEVKGKVKEVARETGEIVTYMVEENRKGVFIYREDAANDLKTARVGTAVSLHSTAAGKAILAYQPAAKIEEILADGLEQQTANTITEKERLLEELEEIRDRGYALNRGERISRLHSVAVPIRDVNEHAIGAIAVTGPRSRMQSEHFTREIPELLASKADKIELNIAHAGNV